MAKLKNKDKIILDLCGGTGAWSAPYKKAGYDVRLIDLPNDIRLLEKQNINVYGILCAPPCRCFTNSANSMKNSITEIIDALSVVDACLRAITIYKPKFWVLENPPGKLSKYLGEPKFKFHPWHFEAASRKLTYLWGNFIAPERKIFSRPGQLISTGNIGRGGDYRRAITPGGFAKAFFKANQ